MPLANTATQVTCVSDSRIVTLWLVYSQFRTILQILENSTTELFFNSVHSNVNTFAFERATVS